MKLYCLIFVLLFRLCISRDTITINQGLIDGDVLISKDGKFSLGFFSPGNSSYRYLGIWFHKVPLKTFVWVVNRDKPINGSSGVLLINQLGILVLNSKPNMGDPVWSANFSMEARDTSATLQLLDTGNLVLFQNESGKILWQSFDHPTDTLLQGMKIRYDRRTGLQQFLTSWRSPDDPGTGDYAYKINPDGAPQIFLYKGLTPYWRTGPEPWAVHLSNDFNRSLANNQDEIYYTFSVTDTSIITRIVVDYSGLVKRMTWQSSANQWKDFWFVPMYRCEKYGHCGAYSNCNPSNIDSFECSCLPGYEPKSLQDWHIRDGSSGCVRKRMDSMSMCQNGEGFVKVSPVKIPDTTVATWVGMSRSKMECEVECLRNCSCRAYASLQISRSQTGCLTWNGDLMDTMVYPGEGYDIYVRVDSIEYAEYERRSKAHEKKKKVLVLVLVTSLAGSLFLVVIIASLLIRRRRKIKGALLESELVGRSHPELPFFNLSTIIVATDNFSLANKLGQGGFGTVYKGRLSDGQEIAVKRLSRNSRQGMEEFRNEMTLIAKLQHRNLVKILGCCAQEEEQILIYEYLLNRSLDSFLFDQTKKSLLDWRKRMDIIMGIARGILYLHQDSRLRIVHRDLKTSNILLDKDMNPKIADFGMAKILEADQIQEKTTKIVGTHGYMSPEYIVFGKFSMKSDVYSFGVILLEIISGKKNNNSYHENPSSLIGHVWGLWKENKTQNIVDSSLKESNIPPEVSRCIQIGLLCVQDEANDRPNMLTVVVMLNGERALPCPKQPAHYFRESSESSKSEEKRGVCSINDVTVTNVEAR